MPYKIKKNETISELVDRFDIPYDIIQRYNPFVLSEAAVYEDRNLTFPRQHVVQPGETYESIGRMYSILPIYMKELNPYIVGPTTVIYPGQTIFLPAVEY